MGRSSDTHGREEKRVQGLSGKARMKTPFERPRRRWEDGIKMDLREIGWGCVEWIYQAQVRDRWRALVNPVMNIRVLEPRIYSVNLSLFI
jgi:hypothetical protein